MVKNGDKCNFMVQKNTFRYNVLFFPRIGYIIKMCKGRTAEAAR